ncbi:IclR family transcriptional regulator domain-containing protein [Pseudonocardia asaccharolytica]|uniref:IclR family transcriptional regulator n=1 Tax=Pseudonocardia asaccharolytica DSM 44247 = NBRC 16224 TaxID=1123024 RepID=A0A511D3N2_9PSEU|nr:IclR family transcriptional regulator C-terminal domain-containing protein [Pseudonocardia asaccharolytica]GEL17518.1 IclR family transcriptional regulator [Pseudonocardia asaccharolytica DSM 44247 = NBRC 16224]
MTPRTGTDRDRIQSIERGFAVLLAFNDEHPNPTLAELASVTGLSRPAVRRILLTLQGLGYVEGGSGRWRLTPRVLSIGQHYAASNALIEVAQPHLLRLAEQTHESASLAALDDTEVVYIARVPVRRIMSINVAVGTRVPAYATSMGRVMLAWAPPEQVERVINTSDMRACTPKTVIDPTRFRAVLRTVRDQGWALVAEELEEGLISASAPVRDQSGAVIAALASSTSTGRSNADRVEAEVVPLLLRTAEQISADLGHRTAASPPIIQGRDGFF